MEFYYSLRGTFLLFDHFSIYREYLVLKIKHSFFKILSILWIILKIQNLSQDRLLDESFNIFKMLL